ncbi:flagellin subunit [Clostridioides difficile]|uniref:Flagellin n=10 Tax=Clostridioides difficile TaxID=1496 RepID=A0A9X8RLU7_CLODI|nr:flagellin subunit [Clostridioides difficile ATCC 9689 = DSM 1296]AXU26225.1 flagellin subunit [Clostridioides difficile]EHJ39341.1 putative flagellar filament core protein [Clostridioides difficile 70-100-2010]CCL09837.1 Flagellin C [Clostridioides difficile E16]CCL14700.1 Flagellin C [Clostridioides difficile T22]CCL18108.1 Flagellin C [Clostridioides difficile E25]CCL22039.1 Flagellin C [Clostridioides difficile T15]CCL49113.1 Flagellin C [Clostridioides difficile T6]CCL52852.1 Flagell
MSDYINEELIKKIKSRNDKDVNYTKEGKIMRVNTNVSALIANNQMGRNVNAQSKSMEKLSSGVRIKRAADDAAGLAISEKMRAQIKGLDQAGRNVQDGISVVQTAEGALEETGNILQRMRTLSVQSSNETNTAEERQKIADELLQLKDEVERISSSIEFNGKKLLDGSSTEIRLQVGANFGTNVAGTSNNNNEIKVALVNTSSIMSKAGITSSTIASLNADGTSGTNAAKQMVSSLDVALKELNTSRAKLGAQQNRLESTQNNLNNTIENVTAAESRIRDTDVASEMVNLSKMNILVQASQSMLAQANQQPQGVLQLLG